MSFEVELLEILNNCIDEVEDISEKDFKVIAQDTAKELKTTSPRDDGTYAQGWAMKKNGDLDYVVYNKTRPGLTHLLENGHVIMNGTGRKYGSVGGRKHIGAARDNAEQKLINKLEIDL